MARPVGSVARERGILVHYPLLVACAYAGIVIWHQGLSASIGLVIATPGHFLEDSIGIIPTSQTLFTAWNAITAAVIFLTLPFVMARLRPADDACLPMPAPVAAEDAETADTPAADRKDTPASRIENRRILNLLFVAVGRRFPIHRVRRARQMPEPEPAQFRLSRDWRRTVALTHALPRTDRHCREDGGAVPAAVPILRRYRRHDGRHGIGADGYQTVRADFHGTDVANYNVL